ncbi:MAG TPA: hypothetical protein VN947_13210 [Polyangia bacterium]|nr:hypothetical protein [Polyangia bacterium]
MTSSTVQLRLRGLMPAHLLMSLVAAVPIARIGYAVFVQHLPYATREPLLTGVSAFLALLPWLWRAYARTAYRAKCDDVAVHVRGEALPYKTIKELRVERGRRRTTLHLVRSEDIQIALVLWDAYAGRLQPIDVLTERLAAHGLTFDPRA